MLASSAGDRLWPASSATGGCAGSVSASAERSSVAPGDQGAPQQAVPCGREPGCGVLGLVRSRVAGGAGQCVSLGPAAQLGGPGRGQAVADGGVYGGLLVVCGWWCWEDLMMRSAHRGRWVEVLAAAREPRTRPAGPVPAPGGGDPVKGRNPSLAAKAGLGAGATLPGLGRGRGGGP